MGDDLKVEMAAVGLIGMRLAALIWGLLKFVVFAAILVGAAMNVLELAPRGWPPFEFTSDSAVAYTELGFATATDVWWVLALLLVVLRVLDIRRAAEEIKKSVSQSKIALVALANYFEIGVETEASKTLREHGLMGLLRQTKETFFLSALFGVDFDDRLTAKPVRSGMAARFRDDLTEALAR